jgi:hypothetical protein
LCVKVALIFLRNIFALATKEMSGFSSADVLHAFEHIDEIAEKVCGTPALLNFGGKRGSIRVGSNPNLRNSTMSVVSCQRKATSTSVLGVRRTLDNIFSRVYLDVAADSAFAPTTRIIVIIAVSS